MKLIEKIMPYKGTDMFQLYVVGDTHIGARNCAENYIKRLVEKIAIEPNSFWIGGGDYINAIKMQDKRRYKPEELPDWLLEGDADTVREKLRDVLQQEVKRFGQMIEPIKHKCIGLIKGNHEDEVEKSYNEAIHQQICNVVGAPDLTDAAFIRLVFTRGPRRSTHRDTVVIFICHGHGGGRTPGAEPNHLARLMMDKDADIILRGHSHSFHIMPPTPILYIPRRGRLPVECRARYKRAANWGCWLRSYAAGPSTYDSRACYPARSLSTLEIHIEPRLLEHRREGEAVSMRELLV